MYDDNSRGLKNLDRPAESTANNQRVLADGGCTLANLTGFQRDLLEAISDLERADETPFGIAIKEHLEGGYEEVLYGRLYANLDELVELGLVAKGEIDGRTNRYTLTDEAETMLEDYAKRLASACGMQVAATDGGRSE